MNEDDVDNFSFCIISKSIFCTPFTITWYRYIRCLYRIKIIIIAFVCAAALLLHFRKYKNNIISISNNNKNDKILVQWYILVHISKFYYIKYIKGKNLDKIDNKFSNAFCANYIFIVLWHTYMLQFCST